MQGCDENSLRVYGEESYTVPGSSRKRAYGLGSVQEPNNPSSLKDKKSDKWQSCTRNTTCDTHTYVDKCGRGYWEDKNSIQVVADRNTSLCRKCSTCYEGTRGDTVEHLKSLLEKRTLVKVSDRLLDVLAA